MASLWTPGRDLMGPGLSPYDKSQLQLAGWWSNKFGGYFKPATSTTAGMGMGSQDAQTVTKDPTGRPWSMAQAPKSRFSFPSLSPSLPIGGTVGQGQVRDYARRAQMYGGAHQTNRTHGIDTEGFPQAVSSIPNGAGRWDVKDTVAPQAAAPDYTEQWDKE